ncbi:rhodanese-like domain-containing protein [Candidatus Ichthyocystis sparus]|uniref:rhodanese-like domain-containing protein n=1 Tax=Candidatus Ichthyocystis sparus TaxID=1561004 RepID=UPI000B81A9DD|nr:rhodanese-like domain-containing protein [Candidatus Ichthyocystis sparus]
MVFNWRLFALYTLADFLLHHWLLSGTAVLSAVGLLFLLDGSVRNALGVDPEQMVIMINKGKVVLIDIRHEDEGLLKGEIKGSRHVHRDKLSSVASSCFSGNRTLLLICQDGSSSKSFAHSLKKEGMAVHYLIGGINAWMAASLPVSNYEKHDGRG